MDRGRLGGLALDIPLNQQQVVAQQTPQQGLGQQASYAPPVAKDPLAERRGMTADYYDSYALLQKIVKDAMSQGIDPFKPDYSQPGGGEAFQAFTEAEALLMHAANRLGNELKAEQQIKPLQVTGQTRMRADVDPQQGFAYSDARNFFPTKLTPGLEETNQRLAQETNDPASQARANQLYTMQIQQLDQQVAQGQISSEEAEYQKQQLIPNRWKTQPFSPKNPPGPSQQEVMGRIQLIKQAKQGILNNDTRTLNLIKMATGTDDATYINDGNRIGLEIWEKGQYTPTFIDFSQGGGEQELNAYLNRIVGQSKIPNEAILGFDTKVEIPRSNVRDVLDGPKDQNGVRSGGAKSMVKEFKEEAMANLKQLAISGKLNTPNGEPVKSVERRDPFWWGQDDGLVVKYHPIENNKVNYNKTKELVITDPDEIDNFIETNANSVAPAFGGGFVTQQSMGLTTPQVVNPGGKKIW